MEKYTQLDYTALTDEVTDEKLRVHDESQPTKGVSMADVGKASPLFLIIVVLLGLMVLVPLGWLVVRIVQVDGFDGLVAAMPSLFVIAVVFLGIVVAFPLGMRKMMRSFSRGQFVSHYKYDVFAAQNNMHKHENPNINGTLLANGAFGLEVRRAYGDGVVEFGEVAYSKKASRRARDFESRMYIAVNLTADYAHMFFDATQNNNFMLLGGQASNMRTILPDPKTKVSTIFDDLFVAYSDSDIAARKVAESEVGGEMRRTAKNFDVEIVGNRLFIYPAQLITIDNTPVFRELFEAAASVGDALNQLGGAPGSVLPGTATLAESVRRKKELRGVISAVGGTALTFLIVVLYYLFTVIPSQ